jgi:hypothetical protein
MTGFATHVDLVGLAVTVDVDLAIAVVAGTGLVVARRRLGQRVGVVMAGGAFLVEGLGRGRVGQLFGFLVVQPVGVVIAPGLAATVGEGVVAVLVELHEGEQVGADAEQVALLVHGTAVGQFHWIDAGRILGILGILGAELELAVAILVEGRGEADRRCIGGRLGADLVLVEAARLVVAMEPELGAGHELVQTLVELGEAGEVLQLALLADDRDAQPVRGLGEVLLILVAFDAGGAADVGGIRRHVAGDLDQHRRGAQFVCAQRLARLVAARQVLGGGRLDIDEVLAAGDVGEAEFAPGIGLRIQVAPAIGGQVVFQRFVVRRILFDFDRRLAHRRDVGGGDQPDRGIGHLEEGLLAAVLDHALERRVRVSLDAAGTAVDQEYGYERQQAPGNGLFHHDPLFLLECPP